MKQNSLISRFTAQSLVILAAALGLGACESDDPQSYETMEDDLKAGGNPKWIYNGPLPALKNVAIVVSLKGHTARVSGDLPVGFAGPLPWYAKKESVGGKDRLTVVYPVATGATASSNGPGAYKTIFGLAYVPTTDKAAWGGFPFLKYHATRGLALHGPITAKDGEWKLLRGPVSHGCNRMQGEHVVELAHLMGMNMAIPHKSTEKFTLSVKVDVIPDYDLWNGKYVDVDYPVQSGVKRPPADKTALFATWKSQDLPRVVCAWNPAIWSSTNASANASHCNYAGTNKINPITGL